VISWVVVATGEEDHDLLAANLLPSLSPLPDGDEFVVIERAESITSAYAEGQARATQPIRCYVHTDVQVRDLSRLRAELAEATQGHGMVGVVGSRDVRMPWWEGDRLGSVVDTRMGLLDFGPGGECAIVDGLVLATRQHVDWDTGAPGWHGYDHDACAQMLDRDLWNFALTNGHELVVHNTTGPTDTARLRGWDEARARFRERWLT
jgi:hypothetical protein